MKVIAIVLFAFGAGAGALLASLWYHVGYETGYRTDVVSVTTDGAFRSSNTTGWQFNGFECVPDKDAVIFETRGEKEGR